MSFTILRTDTGAQTKGGAGDDLLVMTTSLLGTNGFVQGDIGNDLLIGYNGSDDDLMGGGGNDTLMGSIANGIDLDAIATTGLFDIATLFADDLTADYIVGDDGDDWIVLGANDTGDAGEGNDMIDMRFASGTTNFYFGNTGDDTLLANFGIGDTYIYDPATVGGGENGSTQGFTLGSLGGMQALQGMESIRIANARGADGLSDLEHVIGSGDIIVGFDTRVELGVDTYLNPGVIDYAQDGTVPNDSFQILGGHALLASPNFQYTVNGGTVMSGGVGSTLGAADGLSLGTLVFDDQFGYLSLSYTGAPFPISEVIAAANAGTPFRLGADQLDATLVITTALFADTLIGEVPVFVQAVSTKVDLVRVTPEHIDLRGAGLLTGIQIAGSDANNEVHATGFADVLFGGKGNDTLDGLGGNDLVEGGGGDDVLRGEGGNDTLTGASGDDTMLGGRGNDSLRGGVGNDLLLGEAGSDTLLGRAGDDNLNGGDGRDVLDGSSGNDVAYGGAGNDKLAGGSGDDTLYGGDDKDTLTGGVGIDQLFGGAGADRLFGGDGDDTLEAGDGDDVLFGGNGSNVLAGGGGADRLVSNDEDDFLLGGEGDDHILAGGGDDAVYGELGNDSLEGEDGDDFMYGEDGNDTILGGAGNDTLSGNEGFDQLSGGAGADSFDFYDLRTTSSRITTITDFAVGDGDQISLMLSDFGALTTADLRNTMTEVMSVNGSEVHLQLGTALVVFEGLTLGAFATDTWLTPIN